jgi:hypothetical protein
MPGAPLPALSGVILVEALDGLLHVAATLLGLAGNLSGQASDDVLGASNQVARLFLNFAGDVLRDAFDLVFIHAGGSLST